MACRAQHHTHAALAYRRAGQNSNTNVMHIISRPRLPVMATKQPHLGSLQLLLGSVSALLGRLLLCL